MGLFDDYFDPDQFQDSGGLFGRLLSLHPELDFSSSGDAGSQNPFDGPAATPAQTLLQPAASQITPAVAVPSVAPTMAPDPAPNAAFGNSQMPSSADANNSQTSSVSPDIGARLGAAFQGWAQTPVGSPFAALANGINAFNKTPPASAADGSFIGPPAPAPSQAPDFGNRLGAAFQSWAQTPVGSPFAALANGINGFNVGQTSVAPALSVPAQAQTPDNSGHANAGIQNLPAPLATLAPIVPLRRPSSQPRWPRG